MKMLSTSLLILTVFSESFGFDLNCVDLMSGSETDNFDHSTTSCLAFDIEITSPNDAITSVIGNTDPDSMKTLLIRNENVKFMPINVATFFPKLKKLEISNSSLEWIEQANVKGLTSLNELNLDKNNLEILEKGLFDFNTELEIVSVRENKLAFVDEHIFSGLRKLQSIYLENNLCVVSINNQYDYDDDYRTISLSSLLSDRRPYDAIYFKRNAYYNMDRVTSFLHSSCQSWETVYNVSMRISRMRIEELQLENEKLVQGLTHQLKTCDGNLDAALTNFRLQKLMTSTIVPVAKPNDLLIIDLKCNIMVCVVVEFKVPFANMSCDSNYYTIETLQIHQQQTLFLPLNLNKQFPRLKELSVTESGLCEIDLNVFEGLDLLSLNLTKNKISAVPVDTFAFLNDLQVLDLSFNKIDSLFDDVFVNLKSLRQLYLNNNHLTAIQVEIVRNLESLNRLHLQGNRLKYISAILFTPLTSLKSVDLAGNTCINMGHPPSLLADIETTIIDNCILPVELSCKSLRIETSENVQNTSYCNVEDLLIEYPKTIISVLRNKELGLSDSVKIFVVDRQSIKFLPFQLSQQFPNLERIEIQQSNLTALHVMDFVGFLRLTEIVIKNNNLTSINDGTFDTVPQLELLDLSSNGIPVLPAKIFATLTRLHTLILSDNHIVTFMADILPLRNVIEVFRVDNNQLEFIETKTIRFLRRAKLIDLTGNVCIDMQYAKTENGTRALVELSGEINLNCSADD